MTLTSGEFLCQSSWWLGPNRYKSVCLLYRFDQDCHCICYKCLWNSLKLTRTSTSASSCIVQLLQFHRHPLYDTDQGGVSVNSPGGLMVATLLLRLSRHCVRRNNIGACGWSTHP